MANQRIRTGRDQLPSDDWPRPRRMVFSQGAVGSDQPKHAKHKQQEAWHQEHQVNPRVREEWRHQKTQSDGALNGKPQPSGLVHEQLVTRLSEDGVGALVADRIQTSALVADDQRPTTSDQRPPTTND